MLLSIRQTPPNHGTLLPALTFHLPVFLLIMAASLLPFSYVIYQAMARL